jgi:hypothetical protein
MKSLFAALLCVFTSAAFAADVTGVVTVLQGGAVVYEMTNKFVGLTDAEEAALQKSGTAQLDYASKHQDKGGDYTIRWKWGTQPEIETGGMKAQAVLNTMRRGTWWLAEIIDKTEVNAKAGKKHWGHKK